MPLTDVDCKNATCPPERKLIHMGLEVKSLGKVGSTVKWSIRPCDSGGKFIDSSRECRASRDDAENLGKNTPKTGYGTTCTTLKDEISPATQAGDDDVIEVAF